MVGCLRIQVGLGVRPVGCAFATLLLFLPSFLLAVVLFDFRRQGFVFMSRSRYVLSLHFAYCFRHRLASIGSISVVGSSLTR